jgi:hypothetical protein
MADNNPSRLQIAFIRWFSKMYYAGVSVEGE